MKLRKRKNEKSTSWVIDWTDRTGKRRRKVIGITDKKTAELAFAEFQLKLERGEVNLPTDEQMTLSEALEDRIQERTVAGCVPEWISRLGNYRDHMVRYFGPGTRFLSLDDAVVVQYRNSRLAEGAAVETVNKELSFLGSAGRLSVSTSKIAQLPWP